MHSHQDLRSFILTRTWILLLPRIVPLYVIVSYLFMSSNPQENGKWGREIITPQIPKAIQVKFMATKSLQDLSRHCANPRYPVIVILVKDDQFKVQTSIPLGIPTGPSRASGPNDPSVGNQLWDKFVVFPLHKGRSFARSFA